MRRADRLFQIVQNLHHERVITAQRLAEMLEVSERTIYRDIQDLSLSGVPISGEAGQGYRLLRGYHLPPLMFTEEELEALLFGARMVHAWTDQGLAGAAHSAMHKIESVIPERLQRGLERLDITVPDYSMNGIAGEQMTVIRQAIKDQHKLQIEYRREDGNPSNRILHPLGLFYWGKVWTLVAWCELRDDFRSFRLDRIHSSRSLKQRFDLIEGRTLRDFIDMQTAP